MALAVSSAGHDFVLKEFGVKPRIGWQIDPFGHSNTNVRIFAEMGFDAWFFARIDKDDVARRRKDREMEWVWMPYADSLGKDLRIFTHVFYWHYDSPAGLDFEIDSGVQFNANKDSKHYNADKLAEIMLKDLE